MAPQTRGGAIAPASPSRRRFPPKCWRARRRQRPGNLRWGSRLPMHTRAPRAARCVPAVLTERGTSVIYTMLRLGLALGLVNRAEIPIDPGSEDAQPSGNALTTSPLARQFERIDGAELGVCRWWCRWCRIIRLRCHSRRAAAAAAAAAAFAWRPRGAPLHAVRITPARRRRWRRHAVAVRVRTAIKEIRPCGATAQLGPRRSAMRAGSGG